MATAQERVALLSGRIAANVGDMNFALAQTDIGRQRQLANTFADIRVQFGAAFNQIAIVFLPLLNAMVTGLARVAGFARQVAQAIAMAFGGRAPVNAYADTMGGVAAGTGDAIDAQYGLADALKAAGAQARRNKQGFDELNIAGSESGGMDIPDMSIPGLAGGAFDGGILADVEVNPNIERALNMIGDALSLFSPLIDGVKKSFGGLTEFVAGVFTGDWERAWNGARDIFNGFVYGVDGTLANLEAALPGRWGEAVGGIRTAFNGLTEFVAGVFTGDWERAWYGVRGVFSGFVTTVDSVLAGLEEILPGRAGEAVGGVRVAFNGLADFAGGVFTNNWERAVYGIGNVFGGLRTTFDSVLTWAEENLPGRFGEVAGGINTAIGGILTFVEGVFKGDWEKAWQGIEDVFSGVTTAFNALVGESISEIGALGIAILVAKGKFTLFGRQITLFKIVFAPLIGLVKGAKYAFIGLKGAAIGLKDAVVLLKTGGIKALGASIVALKGKALAGLQLKLTALKGAFIKIALPVIAVIGLFAGVLAITGNLGEMIDHLRQIFSGLTDFLGGVFTGDWERAWNGIRNIFSGVFNGIATLLESTINFAIRGINLLVRAANIIPGVNIPPVPDMQLPRIPQLAQGAVIEPNSPFLAILGDQRRGTNIEAPLSTIEAAVESVIRDMDAPTTAGGEINLADKSINKLVDAIIRKLVKALKGTHNNYSTLIQQIISELRQGHVIEVSEMELGRTVSRVMSKYSMHTGGSLLPV